MSASGPAIEFAPYEEVVPGIEMARQRPAGESERQASELLRPQPPPSVIEFASGEEAQSAPWTRFNLWANAGEGDPAPPDDDITALNRMQESLGELDEETRLLRLLIGVWARDRESAWREVGAIVRRISGRQHPLPESLMDEVMRRIQCFPSGVQPYDSSKPEPPDAPIEPADEERAGLVREQATWLTALDGWLLGMVGRELEGYARGELARLRALRVDADDRRLPYPDMEHELLTDELAGRAGERSLLLRSAGKLEHQWLAGCLHRTLQRNPGRTRETKIDVRPEAAPRRGLDEMLAPYRQAR